MSAWTVWQIDRAGRPERVGGYTHGADARRVLRASITRGAVVDPEGEVDEARGVVPRDVTAIEHAAEAWLATAPTAPAPPAVVELPAPVEEDVEDDVEPVGVGAATEAPLPVAFEPPVVEPAPRSFAERAADLRAEIARGRPSADVEHLRVQLADATARAVAAEAARLELDVEHAANMVRIAERDRTIAALRAQLAQRDRTIACLRAELAVAQHDVTHWKESYAQLAAGVTQDLTGETGMLATSDACARIRALRASLDAARERIDELEGQQLADARATELRQVQRERDEVLAQIAAARADLRGRDRTIANLRAELAGIEAHPVVRITAPRVRRVVRAETPVETMHRRLAEIAEGRR